MSAYLDVDWDKDAAAHRKKNDKYKHEYMRIWAIPYVKMLSLLF